MTGFPYHFPVTSVKAEELDHRNKVWYGPYFKQSVTTYSDAHIIAEALGKAGQPSPFPPSIMILNNTMTTPPLDPPSSTTQPSQLLGNHALFQKFAGDDTQLACDADGNVSDAEAELSKDEDEQATSVSMPARDSTPVCHIYFPR